MKHRRFSALAVLLALLLIGSALAEALPEADWIDAPVDEVEISLSLMGVEDGEDGTEEPGESPAPDETTTPEESPTPTPEPTATPEPTPTPKPTPTPTPSPTPEPTPDPDKPAYLRHLIPTKDFKLSKDAEKTVILGLPYHVSVKGDAIKKVVSDAKRVATCNKYGDITLKKVGTATLTISTKGGKTFVLTLNVRDTAAPKDVAVACGKRRFRLSWSGVKHATGYLVEASVNGGEWTPFKAVSADKTALYVTKAVTGATALRVVAILGGELGKTSAAVSVLDKVENVRVICEETHDYGPTGRLNILWDPSKGATGYAVYRAALPSGDYRRIGTTKKTWFADAPDPTKLFAYRVMPLWGDLDDQPLSDPVTLWTGYEDNVLPPRDLTSETGIILLVNKTAQVTTAYIKDAKGRYRLPLRHMICSTGRTYERTRNGTYTLGSRGGEWYTYPGPSGDTIRWPSSYRGGYYFHSPLYNKNHTLRGWTVNQLGNRASAGCVRLKSNDAEWVFKHCPDGTTVYICDGEARDALKEALRPKDVTVRGFDPQ